MGKDNVSKRGLRCTIFLLTLVVCVVVDQASKAVVKVSLDWGKTVSFIPGVLNLVRVENTGAAFSMGEGAGLLFAIIALVVTAGLAVLVVIEDMPLYLGVLCGAIAGGGIGNMIDRLAQGSVTDFFALAFIDFPVFNVADIFVTVGTLLAIIGWIHWDHKRELARQDEPGRQ